MFPFECGKSVRSGLQTYFVGEAQIRYLTRQILCGALSKLDCQVLLAAVLDVLFITVLRYQHLSLLRQTTLENAIWRTNQSIAGVLTNECLIKLKSRLITAFVKYSIMNAGSIALAYLIDTKTSTTLERNLFFRI